MTLTFARSDFNATPFVRAVGRDYATHGATTVWTARSLDGETFVAFLRADGTGFIVSSFDPDGYAEASEYFENNGTFPLSGPVGCPDEWDVFESDAVDIAGDTFVFSFNAAEY